jgi:Tfp pilus assembly protein PilO
MKNYNIKWTDLRKNRLLLILIALCLAVMVTANFLWLAPMMNENSELQARLQQQQEMVGKYKEKLQQAQSIRENMTIQEAELREMQQKLFRGNDPYQLAASIGEMLTSKGNQKIDMKTYQVVANKEYGLYQEVHLRFNFMTNIEGLHFFLDQVKTFPAAILVHEINVQQIQRRQGPDLVVNVILAALMEKGEKT